MLDVGLSELFVIGAVALLVVGPKELPTLMARVGRWTGKARAMARHARAGFDTMVREAEIEEMNKRWEAENARIMAAMPRPSGGDPAAGAATDAPPGPAEPDTFLPGMDGGRAEDRALGPAATAPADPVDRPEPTDWSDPPAPARPAATGPEPRAAAPTAP